MASKAIIDMVIIKKKEPTWESNASCLHCSKHATNWATADSVRVVPFMRLMK
jgi:hypothetical protein